MRAPEPKSKGADPVRVFVILASILVAIGAFFLFTQTDSPPGNKATPTSANETPDFSLTDAEAIARFKELQALKLRLYRTKDRSLIDDIFTADSPSLRIVEQDLEKLIAESIEFRSSYSTEDLFLQTNEATEIRLRQVVIVRPRLIDSDGLNASSSKSQRQTVLWVLHPEIDEWRIYKTVVTSASVQ
jgi:hypothetical protein